jgi:hypothetical protein
MPKALEIRTARIDPHQRARRRVIDPGFRFPGQPPQPAKTTLIADAEIRQSIAPFASQISLGFHLAENSNSVLAQTVDHRSLSLRVAALAGGWRAGDSGEMIIGGVDPSVDRIVIVSPAINGGAIARTEGAREKFYAGEHGSHVPARPARISASVAALNALWRARGSSDELTAMR